MALATADERAKKLKWAEQLRNTRQVIRKSKIRLGFGSDFCAQHQPYETWYEYRAWLRSGMDPFRTLKAATSDNARILGMEHTLGSIVPGKFADISAWSRDLLSDEEALRECAFVMKEGIAYPTGNRVIDEL